MCANRMATMKCENEFASSISVCLPIGMLRIRGVDRPLGKMVVGDLSTSTAANLSRPRICGLPIFILSNKKKIAILINVLDQLKKLFI